MLVINTAAPLSTFHRVAHLSRRAGFGAPPNQIVDMAAGGLERAIDHFVSYDSIPAPTLPGKPYLNDDPNAGDATSLQLWWLDRMIRSPRQLEEKMTFFWHGLFATSNDKVDRPSFMYEQNVLLRRHALGDFQDLLTQISIDPAMLVWLDGDGSTKAKPNENFAREAMELFSIGIGNYSQRDVRESARALTGWSIDGHFIRRFHADDHDHDVKSFLGHVGRFDHRDIARILANHPACGRFLARKLWTFFAYEGPDDHVLDELAGVYRSSSRSIRAVVDRMFHMPAFYGSGESSVRVKTPVEYAVTAVREFGARVPLRDLNDYSSQMGQTLLYPPNVGGWPTGTRWISSATVVGRFSFAEWLFERHDRPSLDRVQLSRLRHRYISSAWDGVLENLALYHLPSRPAEATIKAMRSLTRNKSLHGDEGLTTLEAVLHLMLVSPDYYCA